MTILQATEKIESINKKIKQCIKDYNALDSSLRNGRTGKLILREISALKQERGRWEKMLVSMKQGELL